MSKKYKPTLAYYAYNFINTQKEYCEECKKTTKQEVYYGDGFAEGSTIIYCLNCKIQMLV